MMQRYYVLLISLSFYLYMSRCLEIPVLFVSFGHIPDYLKVNIELATARNHVILLSDDNMNTANNSNSRLIFANISNYNRSATRFSSIYKSKLKNYPDQSPDQALKHEIYELQCFQRWFIIYDYMVAHHIDLIFYADGDSAVFANVSYAYGYRNNCSAVINVPHQESLLYWVGAGEASYFTISALDDFLTFTSYIYQERSDILDAKANGSNIVDMSFLWLWWAIHMDNITTVMTYHHLGISSTKHRRSESCISYVKNLNLVVSNRSLVLCNGMDVTQEDTLLTVFDHRHGFSLSGFTFDQHHMMPYFLGTSLRGGGKSSMMLKHDRRSYANATVTRGEMMSTMRIYLNSVHYQGHQKDRMIKDVCAYLSSAVISNHEVARICQPS